MIQFGIASFKFDITLSGSFTYFKFPMCSIFKLLILFRDSSPSSVTLGQSTTSSHTNWWEQVADKYFIDLSLMYLKNLKNRVRKFLFPRIVSAATILFWIWPYVLWPLVTVHKSAETIQGRKLFAEIRYSENSNFWSEQVAVSKFVFWNIANYQRGKNTFSLSTELKTLQPLTYHNFEYKVLRSFPKLVDGWVSSRVSIQGVKSLGGHFACLCWGFDFCEVKKNPFIYSKKHTFLTKKCLNNKKFRKSDRYSLFVLIVKKMN